MPEAETTGDSCVRLSRVRCCEGWQETWQHDSHATGTPMKFAIYLPPQAESRPCPVFYWLSGLTCTEENFVLKAGAQRYAAELGWVIVCPDTSPRGANLPGEDDSWDFGTGAGFYLDAVQAPWSSHYKMESYVVEELPRLIESRFPVTRQRAVSGHSMGGHGALVLALRYPGFYSSVSAFAPIAAPSDCPWGHKAFGHYLGEDRGLWEAYDAHLLLQKSSYKQPLLVDQGTADGFLAEQLKPEKLQTAAREADYPLTLRYQSGYDHSYFFVSSFIGEHLAWHSAQLENRSAG